MFRWLRTLSVRRLLFEPFPALAQARLIAGPPNTVTRSLA
jgi:hypothetical protein